MKEIYIKRKAKHVCVVCGEKDERTIAGKIRCAKCEKTELNAFEQQLAMLDTMAKLKR